MGGRAPLRDLGIPILPCVSDYRRNRVPGGSFFTVNLLDRRSDLLVTQFTCCGTLFGRYGSTRPSASTPGSSFPTICTACGPYRQAMPSSPVAGAIKTAFSKEAGQELFWRMFSRHPGAGRGPFRRGTTIGKALSLLENSGAAARWVPAFAGKTIEYFAGRAARLVFLPGLESFSAREPAMTSRDGAASATAVGLVGSSPSRGATIASSSRRRWPTDAMPRSSVVKLGNTAPSMSLPRNTGSYCPSPRPRSHPAISMRGSVILPKRASSPSTKAGGVPLRPRGGVAGVPLAQPSPASERRA